jgi:hypothetical protein
MPSPDASPIDTRTRAIAIVACAPLVLLLAGWATPDAGAPPGVPDALRVPASQTLALAVRAVGVQIYDCKPGKADPSRFEWAFRAPEADLFDAAGTKIGIHYAGPTWESNDGSRVVGEAKAQDDGPDTTAISWLLLRATSNSGVGALGRVASIQRMQTVGGRAPAAGCSAAQAGKEARVPYRATYYFYVDDAMSG